MTEMSGSAELFNELSFHMLTFLEDQMGVSELNFENRSGCAAEEVYAWERTNAPYKVPNDLKAFLTAFDGLRFSWRVDMANRGNITVGSMRLHRLRDMLQVPLDVDDDEACRSTFRVYDDDDADDGGPPAPPASSPSSPAPKGGGGGDGAVLAAFGIEHYPRVGKARLPAPPFRRRVYLFFSEDESHWIGFPFSRCPRIPRGSGGHGDDTARAALQTNRRKKKSRELARAALDRPRALVPNALPRRSRSCSAPTRPGRPARAPRSGSRTSGAGGTT